MTTEQIKWGELVRQIDERSILSISPHFIPVTKNQIEFHYRPNKGYSLRNPLVLNPKK